RPWGRAPRRAVYSSHVGARATTRAAAAVLWNLDRRLAEPVLEADLAESRLPGRDHPPLAGLGPEVPRVRVDHDLPGVVARTEALTDQLVEAELLRTGDVDGAVQGGTPAAPPPPLGQERP